MAGEIELATVRSLTFVLGHDSAGLFGKAALPLSQSPATNVLGADVAMNNTGNFFDGPSVAPPPGATLVRASGQITIKDTGAGGGLFFYKLWDGTTVIASGSITTANASQLATVSLSGQITNPTGNIRMSCKDQTAITGVICFNAAGPNCSSIEVTRIA